MAFAVALAITIAAALARFALAPLFAPVPFGGMPYAVAFLGVLVTTFLCGTAAGVLGLLLSVAAVWRFIMPLHMTMLAPYQTLAFMVGALTMIAIIATMRLASA